MAFQKKCKIINYNGITCGAQFPDDYFFQRYYQIRHRQCLTNHCSFCRADFESRQLWVQHLSETKHHDLPDVLFEDFSNIGELRKRISGLSKLSWEAHENLRQSSLSEVQRQVFQDIENCLEEPSIAANVTGLLRRDFTPGGHTAALQTYYFNLKEGYHALRKILSEVVSTGDSC
jgi:hypothetical protein